MPLTISNTNSMSSHGDLVGGSGGSIPSAPLPFDVISGARAGYSTRKIRSAYNGLCMNVRDGNNVIHNVGFDSFGKLDIATIETIAQNAGGTSDVTVSTWFDQSGNGNDLTMPAVATQPIIWSKGTLSGLPSQNGIIKSNNGGNVGPQLDFPGVWFWYDGSNTAYFDIALGDPASGQPNIGANQSFGVNPGIFACVFQPNTGPGCTFSTMSMFGKAGSGNISNYHPIAQTGSTSVEIFRGLRVNGVEDAPLNPPGIYFDGTDITSNITNRNAAYANYVKNTCTPQNFQLYIYSAKNMTWNTASHLPANRFINYFGQAGSASWSIKSIVQEILFFDNNSDNNNLLDNTINEYYKTY